MNSNQKLVTFTVDGQYPKTTRVSISSAKKSISYDPEFDNENDLFDALEMRAVAKMYGQGTYFMGSGSDIKGQGQICRRSPITVGVNDCITGTIYLNSDF